MYSSRGGVIHVPERSGLNQWNANGRPRDPNEVYIPIPKKIHNLYPNFFPDRDTIFQLDLPNNSHLSAKVCQAGGKALMSNPNQALGEWILRKVLNKPIGSIVTMEDLLVFGIDSVLIEKAHKKSLEGMEIFRISFVDSSYENYNEFIESTEDEFHF